MPRTINDHHRDAEKLARVATRQILRGVSSVEVRLGPGDVLVLRRKQDGAWERLDPGVIPLMTYWLVYDEIDALLRELRPIEETP